MTFYISNPAAIAACDAVVDLCDAGAGAATVRILDGAVPADADAAETGTLLAELTMSDPAFGAAALSGDTAVATAATITPDTSANASGTASYFRIVDSNSNVIMQGTVGTSGADLNMNSVAIAAGAQVSITSLTYTHPESV
jgi:hypothetical protein